MKTSKTTKKSKSNQLSFGSTSLLGDVNDAFRKAKEKFQAAGLVKDTLGKISVVITFLVRGGKGDPPAGHQNKDITATSPRNVLQEAFREAKEKFQKAKANPRFQTALPQQLRKVTVTIRVNLKKRRL
jgi:flagellar hook-basal body complex protein FliE